MYDNNYNSLEISRYLSWNSKLIKFKCDESKLSLVLWNMSLKVLKVFIKQGGSWDSNMTEIFEISKFEIESFTRVREVRLILRGIVSLQFIFPPSVCHNRLARVLPYSLLSFSLSLSLSLFFFSPPPRLNRSRPRRQLLPPNEDEEEEDTFLFVSPLTGSNFLRFIRLSVPSASCWTVSLPLNPVSSRPWSLPTSTPCPGNILPRLSSPLVLTRSRFSFVSDLLYFLLSVFFILFSYSKRTVVFLVSLCIYIYKYFFFSCRK